MSSASHIESPRAEPPAETAGPGLRRINRRAAVVLAVLAVAMVVLLGRVFHLQRASHAEMLGLAERQSTMTIRLRARRGLICDAAGLLMAGNSEVPSVYADPKFIAKVAGLQAVSGKLSRLLGLDAAALYQRLLRRRQRRHVWVRRQVTPGQAEAVRQARLPGVVVAMEPIRRYPQGRLAAHVIGFKGRDIGGLTGIEYGYNAELAGEDGSKKMVATAGRRGVWLSDAALRPARHGRTLILTLHATIQQIVEEALDELDQEHAPRWSSCIVMDPDTGAIIAMANRPTYEPQSFGDFPEESRVNRAISYPIEPGSIFKPFIAIRALYEGKTHYGERIHCHNGMFYYRGRRLRDHHPYGGLTFEEIVYRSSNIGMAILGIRLGKQLVYDTEVRFGFGSQTGIDLPCEDAGLITLLAPDPNRPHAVIWNDIYTLTSVPMGHEIAATPLQLLTAFGALANGGRLMRPHVVSRIVDPVTGKDIRVTEPTMIRRVLPESTVLGFRERVLAEVVANRRGTGRRAKLENYRLFGKTGTAQIPRQGGGGYVEDEYVANFLCGGPLTEPRLVCIVTAFVPSKGHYYGGRVAAPVAGKIMRRALAFLRVPSDKATDA